MDIECAAHAVADAAPSPRSRKPPTKRGKPAAPGLSDLVAQIAERSRVAAEAAAELRRQQAADRARAARARAALVQRWLATRAALKTAADEIDAALAPYGLYLSPSDDMAYEPLLAAMEVRLFVHGRPAERWLDITVDQAGRVRAEENGPGRPRRITLPDASGMTAGACRDLLLAFVERAIPGDAFARG